MLLGLRQKFIRQTIRYSHREFHKFWTFSVIRWANKNRLKFIPIFILCLVVQCSSSVEHANNNRKTSLWLHQLQQILLGTRSYPKHTRTAHTDALNIKILHQSVAFKKTFGHFDAICRTMRHEIKSRSYTAACSGSRNAEKVKNATDSQVNARKNFSGDSIYEEREEMKKTKPIQKTSTRTFFPCVLRIIMYSRVITYCVKNFFMIPSWHSVNKKLFFFWLTMKEGTSDNNS